MLGELFLPTDTPEQPKQSFFKNLFTGGPATLDREELCESYYVCVTPVHYTLLNYTVCQYLSYIMYIKESN